MNIAFIESTFGAFSASSFGVEVSSLGKADEFAGDVGG